MSKVYILTEGDYSDKSITKVFSSLEKAQNHIPYGNELSMEGEGWNELYFYEYSPSKLCPGGDTYRILVYEVEE